MINQITSYSILCNLLLLTSTTESSMQIQGSSPIAPTCTFSKKNFDILNSIQPDIEMRFNETVHINLERGEAKRYFLTVNEPSPLSITFSSSSSSCTNNTMRKLFFNSTINLSRHVNLSSISIPCAPAGRYDLLLMPILPLTKCIWNITINQHNPYSNWRLLDQIEPSRVRHQNRIQKRQMIIKWDKSKLDIHAINYCVAIGTERNQRSLCEAFSNSLSFSKKLLCARLNSIGNFFVKKPDKTLNIRPNSVTVTCLGKKNRQILRNVLPNTEYFIDIFGIHTALNNLTFPLRSTSVWFNRSHPIVVGDGQMITAKLSEFGRQTVFSFKVPLKSSSAATKIQILPCGTDLTVKVFKQKALQTTLALLHKPTIIPLENMMPGDRFIVKVAATDAYAHRRTHKMGISVTTQKRFPMLPELPNNTSVEEISAKGSCDSTWIAWHASPDTRDIRYCVFWTKTRNTFVDDFTTSSICDVDVLSLSNPYQINCFKPTKKINVQSFKLVPLASGTLYTVHVMVQINNISLPYDLLRISTSTFCYNFDDDNKVSSLEDASPPPHIKISSSG